MSGNNSGTATTSVTTQADLSVTKSGPRRAIAGTAVGYVIRVRNTGEAGMSAWTVYIDSNRNGQRDSGELNVKTDASGNIATPGQDNQNNYVLFSAGGLDFVAVGLSYGVTQAEVEFVLRKADGIVSLTEAGRVFYESKVRRRRRARSGWTKSAPAPTEGTEDRTTRAEAIREAVDALQRAVSDADRLEIGDLDAPAEQAFAALLELADRIDRGLDPRRITRG